MFSESSRTERSFSENTVFGTLVRIGSCPPSFSNTGELNNHRTPERELNPRPLRYYRKTYIASESIGQQHEVQWLTTRPRTAVAPLGQWLMRFLRIEEQPNMGWFCLINNTEDRSK